MVSFKTARGESIQVLQDLAQKKKSGQLLIAAGCLTERYRQALVDQVPGLDGLLSTRRWMDIVQVVQKLRENQPHATTLYHLPDEPTVGKDERGVIRAPAREQFLSEDCRWLPQAMCFLFHPFDQGNGGQPPD